MARPRGPHKADQPAQTRLVRGLGFSHKRGSGCHANRVLDPASYHTGDICTAASRDSHHGSRSSGDTYRIANHGGGFARISGTRSLATCDSGPASSRSASTGSHPSGGPASARTQSTYTRARCALNHVSSHIPGTCTRSICGRTAKRCKWPPYVGEFITATASWECAQLAKVESSF